MFLNKDIDDIVKEDIESNPVLTEIIENFGGIIAGGASHALLRGHTLRDYLRDNNCADIDVYFKTEKHYNAAVKELKLRIEYPEYRQDRFSDYHLESSITGLCHNLHFNYGFIRKIQLVGCVFGSGKDIVQSFDFKNLEVFCSLIQGKYRLLYSKTAEENKRELVVRHSKSPFLMYRIYKYINYRGYDSITKDTRTHLTDWIIKASSGYYYDNPDGCKSIYVDLLNNAQIKSVISNRELISDEDLVYMIGKVKEDIFKEVESITSRGYSSVYKQKDGERDLVIEEIRNRG